MANIGSAIGCKPMTTQDCLDSKWSIHQKETITLYRSTEIVTATGVIDMSSASKGMTLVTLSFWLASIQVAHYTLQLHQCLGFTVSGFDTIKLAGNGSLNDIAAGRFSLTLRYL